MLSLGCQVKPHVSCIELEKCQKVDTFVGTWLTFLQVKCLASRDKTLASKEETLILQYGGNLLLSGT